MTFVIRIGGTSEFVSHIDPDAPHCYPPGDIETVPGWDNPLMLHFETREEAEVARRQAEEADGCHCCVEEVEAS